MGTNEAQKQIQEIIASLGWTQKKLILFYQITSRLILFLAFLLMK